ncbi:hypothetical protein D9613_011082 [Agrocybe pediades]|uniref:Conidiation-specific protein 6 n=1 Tax=Agrocybe pediades TaxID=84607 RepID=A0A8H4QL99_9AGAR|nr:hypothetical protein D9613_011082 [Agrocybe pediades]KAF9563806.1 hypothetical protein CPC08DRAFT_705716 [Agrocybe pediades]
MPSTQKNPGNVAGGLKATLHNDRVSDEAKQSAQERLDRMGGPAQGNVLDDDLDDDEEFEAPAGTGAKSGGRSSQVLGGYKATLKNPRVSDEAKQHAQDVLDKSEA